MLDGRLWSGGWIVSSLEDGGDSFEGPEGGHRPHCIDRQTPWKRYGELDPGQGRGNHHEAYHEYQLSKLDPHIEGEERHRDFALGQSDFPKRTGEAHPMEQAEEQCDRPWMAAHQGLF